MPHFLARLPLTALATSLATSVAMSVTTIGAISTAQAAEPGPMAYVFDGLDGPDLVTAPGLATLRVDSVQLGAAGLAKAPLAATAQPSLPPLSPAARVMLPATIAMPQGPMPDGTALSSAPSSAVAGSMPDSMGAATDPVSAMLVDARGELLPLDPAQPPVAAAAAHAPAKSVLGQARSAVLSLLDGPGPLPLLRPVASMVSGPQVTGLQTAGQEASSPARRVRGSGAGSAPGSADPARDDLASAATAAGGGDPPESVTSPVTALEPASDPAPELEPESEPEAASGLAPANPEEVESLRDAIVASLKGNPEIQIALAQQDDAKYGVTEARAGYLPKVDVTAAWGREIARNVPQAMTERFRTDASITLNQNLWDFGVTINDIKRARATYRSAQWGTREKIEAISYDITNAYLGVLLQQKLVELGEAEIASIKKILRIVTVQKDLGLTTPADVERAQTRLENIRSQLLDRVSGLEQARNAYKRLTNRLPLRAIDGPAAGQALPESGDVAVDMIDTRSPRLAQAVEDRRSLDKQYDSQADTTLPRFGLTLASDYRRDVLGATGRAFDARAMVTVSYQLYNGGATTAIKRRIGARLRQADYELDRRRREVEQDIRVDYAALGAANEKIATIEDEITSAQRVADLYKQQFRGGRRTVFDLLDSQQLLFAAQAKQAANQIALRAAECRVLQKLGGLFDLVSGGQPLPALVVPAPGSED